MGLEQKQIRSRLRDVHGTVVLAFAQTVSKHRKSNNIFCAIAANISETLLDALTDLMAEEGGIGIDKLACDINIDVDIGDVVLQDDEIQVFL